MTWPLWPWNAVLLIGATGLLWAASVAIEWHLEREKGDDRHVSPAWRGDQARAEMSQGWDRQIPWAKQRKGAAPLWDRRPAKLKDVSRRAS
jgi:hypothetical protein